MLRHVHAELDMMTAMVESALLHCSTLQTDDIITNDLDLERNAHHLRARVESVALQLEDTIQTLHRLESQYKLLPDKTVPALQKQS
jgi:hypothetical protein